MKFYTDEDKVTLVQTITSANTFVSSITGIIKNYILKTFPKGYFKYIYTDTSETYQEHNKTDLYNKSLHKITYPSLTVTPQLSLDNPVGGMKSILMSSPNFWLPRDLNRQFPTLLEDPTGENKYKIYFSSDYTTMNIRFKIVTDSFIQATEIGYFLKSRFNDENTFKYLSNQLLQVEMPKSFVKAIAVIENKFVNNEDGTEQETSITNDEDLKWLDLWLAQVGRRAKPILRKKSLNTSKFGYFYHEKENLLVLFTDLDMPEGVIRDNSVNGEYEITFRVQVSAWWPNAFMMVIPKNNYQTISRVFDHGTNDSNDPFFYSLSIGAPVALDRKNSIVYQDDNENTLVGINVKHDVISISSPEPITSLNIASLIWG